MAGDWIKMRADLFTHPKVVRISSALKADTLRTVGGLMSVWCLFDAHSIDGQLEGYSPDYLDSHLRWDGFAQAMISVGWLVVNAESLELPSFDTHNGESAKRRIQDTERKRVRRMSASETDKSGTREEKRREEKRRETLTSSGDEQTAKIDYSGIVGLYHKTLPELPKVKLLTDKRKSQVKTCSAVKPTFSTLEFWEAYFSSVRNSAFHMGQNDRGWTADFDWLTNKTNFVKMYERGCQ